MPSTPVLSLISAAEVDSFPELLVRIFLPPREVSAPALSLAFSPRSVAVESRLWQLILRISNTSGSSGCSSAFELPSLFHLLDYLSRAKNQGCTHHDSQVTPLVMALLLVPKV